MLKKLGTLILIWTYLVIQYSKKSQLRGNMWQELKEKLPKKVKWASDGEEGEGVLHDMNISETFVQFMINDSIQGHFSLGSRREFLGASGDINGLRISAPYMGEIVVLPEKKEDGR